MKKIILLFLFCLFWSFTVYAQGKKGKIIEIKPTAPKPKKPTPTPDSSWYISYEVDIKGHGTVNDKPGEGDETTWSIDRKYTGTVELNFESPGLPETKDAAEMRASIKNNMIMKWTHYSPKTGASIDDLDNFFIPIHIVINDKYQTLVKDEGEGSAFENTTVLEEWKADCDERTNNILSLVFYKKSRHHIQPEYDVTIPLVPHSFKSEKANVTLSTTTSIKRSPFGYDDKPTSEIVRDPDKLISASEIKIPSLRGVLKDGDVHPFIPMTLELKDGGYEMDWGENPPDEPMISGIPETETGVEIHIYYRFVKKPKK